MQESLSRMNIVVSSTLLLLLLCWSMLAASQPPPAGCTLYQPCLTTAHSGFSLVNGQYVCACFPGWRSADPCLNDCSVSATPPAPITPGTFVAYDDSACSSQIHAAAFTSGECVQTGTTSRASSAKHATRSRAHAKGRH